MERTGSHSRIGGLILLALWSFQTWEQSHVWITDTSIWEHAIQVSPDKPGPRINLCADYLMQMRFTDAQEQCNTALFLAEGRHDELAIKLPLWTNLGKLEGMRRNYSGAMALFDLALSKEPNYGPALVSKAAAMLRHGARCSDVQELVDKLGMQCDE